MPNSDFVHLHNHTMYSLLDGATRIEDMVQVAVESGMPALAITDHGSMFGVIEFYKAAQKANIKPIIGCEFYVAVGSRHDKSAKGIGETYHHLILLAKDLTGYKNLMCLSSIGYLEGFYYRPRVDKEVLREYREGVIALSGCAKGEIPSNYIKGHDKVAEKAAREYREIFGDDFYLEIQDHNLEDERYAKDKIVQLSKKLSIPIVATNDVHFLQKEHWKAHNILICLQTGKDMDDPKRMRYPEEVYLKSPEEMFELFQDQPKALENTLAIAEKCNLKLELGKTYLPDFPLPGGERTLDEYLERLAWEGVNKRYSEITPDIKKRLEFELSIIKQMGYAGYFLIVMDFVNYARSKNIPVGPGRGSGGGSLVSYALSIINIDPIKYDLPFERFLNPDRVSLPDFDIDFCYERRGEIIEYVKQKYGKDNVAQIISFGSMASRGVLKDVGRVLGVDYNELDHLSKAIPVIIGKPMPLEQAINVIPELKEVAQSSEEKHVKLLEYSRILEGLARHASTHAAGVVIAPDKVVNFTPLFKLSQTNDVTTQYNLKSIEDIGLLKIDFLGLRTLTIIHDTLKMLEKRDIEIDIDTLSLDDKTTYRIFENGETVAVFQFESSGMAEYLKKLKPERIEDLIAMNALYRPGPMEMIDDFIDYKFGHKKIEYIHPKLEPILKETYGICVYQEQVMRIANEVAGFTLAQADLMRRAMGKKDAKIMAEQRERFTKGAVERGINNDMAEEIFNLLNRFASYGFNKSHATAYAIVAYQTAYLKAHYPREFMAANLSNWMGDLDELGKLIEECRRMGIKILPPDINESDLRFTVVGDGIRFGLGAIKNVGEGSIEGIIKVRENDGKFKTIFDFCERVNNSVLNKKVLESLILAGAFDSLKDHRAQLMAVLDQALERGQYLQSDRQKGQISIFEIPHLKEDTSWTQTKLPDVPKWSRADMLAKEKEMLGFYVSGHPLEKYREDLETFATCFTRDFARVANGGQINIGGIIIEAKTTIDRKGKQMAFLTLEDLTGTIEVLAFSSIYEVYKPLLQVDSMVMIKGKLSARAKENTKLVAEEVFPLDEMRTRCAKSVNVVLSSERLEKGVLDILKSLVSRYRGDCAFYLHIDTPQHGKVIVRSRNTAVSPCDELLSELRGVVGAESVWLG